jgi:hypothetical protein
MMNDVDDERENNIETDRLRQLEFRRQVDSNDPSLLHADIGIDPTEPNLEYSGYSPHDGDWGEYGASIGRNTFIKKVDILIGNISQGDFESFARGFASNRSVQSLTIDCDELAAGEALGALLPFFMNNPAFKSLHIMCAESTCLHVLASVLRQFAALAEFTLYDYEHNDDNDDFDEYRELIKGLKISEDFSAALSEIFDALTRHSSLTKLSIEQSAAQYHYILSNGWESLTALLRKSSSNLMVLELEGTPMDNGGASILAGGILENASLKEFSLHRTQHMTKNGWDTIFAALKRSTCTLEKLSISYRIRDDVRSTFSNALLDLYCTLKSLSLCGDDEYAPNPAISNRGALFQLLLNPDCALEILDLNNVGLNNDSIMCLRKGTSAIR